MPHPPPRNPRPPRGRPAPRPPSHPAQPAGPPRDAQPAEAVFGLRAALAVFAHRRDDVLRVALTQAARREAGELVRWAASRGVPCAEVAEPELARLAGTPHHEGLCVFARPRRWASPDELAEALLRGRGAGLALDRVRNPYNVGAILRSAAFFGLDAVLLGALAPHPALAPDAVRVAEGGSESLRLARTTDLAESLGRLRARGVRVVGTDGHAPTSALGFRFERPTILVMGHEREGLSDRVRARCDAVVAIRGSGAVESLNVGVAAGLLIAELVRPG